MESSPQKAENAQSTKTDIQNQIEEMKLEISKKGIDPVEYIENELTDLKLNTIQKKMLKDCISNEKYQENFRLLLKSLKSTHSGNYKALKKIESIAPLYDAHDFWDSQPVPKAYEKVEEDMLERAIDVDRTVDEIRDKPYNLPEGFQWSDVDVGNNEQAQEVYTLLT